MYAEGKDYYSLIKNSVINLSKYALPLFVVAFFATPWVFDWILGSAYEFSGIIAQILIPWIAFNFISSPISSFPQVLGKQKQFLLISSTGNFTSLMLLFTLSLYFTDFIWPFIGYSGSMMIAMMVIIFWNIQIAKSSYESRSVKSEA